MPFLARRGGLMEAWSSVAVNLASAEGFDRPNFDGKKASNRFMTLLESHRSFNRKSVKESGISEEESEKIVLLDDLMEAYDDAEQEKKM